MNKVHKKIDMKKNVKYRLNKTKALEAHRWRCRCNCGDEVTNLLGGKRIWTRIEFECGERTKVNCHCLEKI